MSYSDTVKRLGCITQVLSKSYSGAFRLVDFVRIDFARIDLMGVDLMRIDLMGVPWCERETIMRERLYYTYTCSYTY